MTSIVILEVASHAFHCSEHGCNLPGGKWLFLRQTVAQARFKHTAFLFSLCVWNGAGTK